MKPIVAYTLFLLIVRETVQPKWEDQGLVD
jgi:hypothetical protein